MTTNLVLVRPDQTVGEVRRILRAEAEHQADVDAVIIVDEDGRVVHDLGLFELLVAASDDLVIDVAGPPEPVTVEPETTLDDVIEQFIDSRGSSLLVVDDGAAAGGSHPRRRPRRRPGPRTRPGPLPAPVRIARVLS